MIEGVFLGLTGLDVVYYLDSLPAENKKTKCTDYLSFIGGPAANAAITFSLLGGKAILITSLGSSELSASLKKELSEKYSIEVIDLTSTLKTPNVSSIFINTLNGSRTIVSGQSNSDFQTSEVIIDKLLSSKFVLSDCNLNLLAEPLLKLFKKNNVPIVLDVGSKKDHLDSFISLADEVIASSDCNGKDYDIFDHLNTFKLKNFAVTNGESDIRWNSSNKNGVIIPRSVYAVDTLGAGDIFHGAFCYYRFRERLSFVESLSTASEIASTSVQFKGPREWANKLQLI